MSDTPPRKPGVPTLTTIGYTGSLTGQNSKPGVGGRGPSTQQGFAPLTPEQLRALDPRFDETQPRTPPYPAAPVPPAPVAAPPAAPAARSTVPPTSVLPRAPMAPMTRAVLPQAAPIAPPASAPVRAAAAPAAAPAAPVTPAGPERPRAAMSIPATAPADPRVKAPLAPGSPPAGRARPPVSDEAMTNVWQQLDSGTDEVQVGRRFARWWFLLPVVPLCAIFGYLLFSEPE